jgi:hypothetical protein
MLLHHCTVRDTVEIDGRKKKNGKQKNDKKK